MKTCFTKIFSRAGLPLFRVGSGFTLKPELQRRSNKLEFSTDPKLKLLKQVGVNYGNTLKNDEPFKNT